MLVDNEFRKTISEIMMHCLLVAYSAAEDIEEDYPVRAKQLKDVNEMLGKMFNIFVPEEGLEKVVQMGDEFDETND